MTTNEESPLKFPCEYPIKAMGLATDNFDAFVVNIVKRHAPSLDDTTIRTRSSSNNKYVSVTITIEAKSRDQLDAIYLELTASKRVLFAL